MVEAGGDAAKGLALRGFFREEADAPAGPLWHPGQDPGHHGADEDQVELSELGRILPKDGEDCVGGTAQALRVSGPPSGEEAEPPSGEEAEEGRLEGCAHCRQPSS